MLSRRWSRFAGALAGAGALVLAGACARPSAPEPRAAPTGLTIRLSAPASTPAAAAVYVAGDFNGWNPAAAGYGLVAQPGGGWALTLPDSVRGPIAFKFTLGSWDNVEISATGGDVPNRTLTVPPAGAVAYDAVVAGWRSGSAAPRAHTASASVSVLSDSFPMPQLGRTRRVWLYLPPDYATSGRRYPVLYLHDGQNVFDAATSFAGEWGVDETLDSLHAHGDAGIIVVAVDNGTTHRMDEYSPWKNPKYGGGEGDAYVEFLARTLKPYIDAHYRTLPDRLNTGVGGSSMGGLISLYAAFRYPDIFGRVAAFSSALWIAPPMLALARQATPLRPDPRFYLVVGGREGSTPEEAAQQVRGQEQVVDSLVAAGFRAGTEIQAYVRPDGAHSEWFWRREFPAAYLWLFGRR